jgi:hypothetical protein
MDPLRVTFDLANIECLDEGDGPGDAEPYLWTVFFKVDGSTASINPQTKKLEGASTVVSMPGDHGDLGDAGAEVDAGETVPIPSAVGHFATTLTPIPVKGFPSLAAPGVVGCLAVLLEEDSTPDDAIVQGHQALNQALKQAIDSSLPSINLAQGISQTTLDGIADQVSSAAESAVADHVSFWDGVWGFLSFGNNQDDLIGQARFIFSQNQLEKSLGKSPIPLSQHWDNEGSWTLNGQVSVAPVPKWHAWQGLGPAGSSGLGVSSWAEGRLDLFANGDGSLLHKAWDGHWSDWQTIQGDFKGAPTAVSWGPNRIDVFVLGTDDHVGHMWWDGAKWNGWQDLGGPFASAPAVASWAAGRLDLFIRGNDSGLWHRAWNGQWTAWEKPIQGVFKDDPTAVSWGPNRIDVLVRGVDDHVGHMSWTGSNWHGWDALGGTVTSAPTIASWAPNRLDAFVRGSDTGLHHIRWAGSSWNTWEKLTDGVFKLAPVAVSWGPERIDVFVHGTDDQVGHLWFG